MNELELAQAHMEVLEKQNYWTMLIMEPDHTIKVEYGAVHTNGERERAIATRHYYMVDGRVAFWTAIHP